MHRAYKYRYVDDREEIRFLLSVLQDGDTAIDIGAHKGGYTYWMDKAVGHLGKVIAFEPQPAGARLLRQLFPHVTVEQAALSDHSGEKVLYIKPRSYEVSFEASLSADYPDALTQSVQTITLDDYCSRRRLRPRFIKIDVEGHELEVIRGAVETLKLARPYMLIEIEKRHIGAFKMQELLDHLEGLGYWGYFVWRGNRQSVKNFDFRVHQALKNIGKAGEYINNFMFEPK